MTFDEIKSVLASRLGSRTDLDAEIATELKLAQRNMEHNWPDSTMPWFLLSDMSISYYAVQTQPLPDGYIRDYDEGMAQSRFVTEYDDGSNSDRTSWTPAEKMYGEVSQLFDMRDTTFDCEVKLIYSIFGGNVVIYPTLSEEASFDPSGAWRKYTELYVPCYLEQPVEDTGITSNAWTDYAPELLIAAAGRQLARYLHDGEIAALFEQDYQMEYQKLLVANQERQNANIEMVVR